MSDLQKNTLPDRPTLPDFDLVDQLPLLFSVRFASRTMVGENRRWLSLTLTVARSGGFEQIRGFKRIKPENNMRLQPLFNITGRELHLLITGNVLRIR